MMLQRPLIRFCETSSRRSAAAQVFIRQCRTWKGTKTAPKASFSTLRSSRTTLPPISSSAMLQDGPSVLTPWKKKDLYQTQQCRAMGSYPKLTPRRIRVITCDVTGTLVSFRGSLEQHYLGAAQKIGIEISDEVKRRIGSAFNQAYREMSDQYPCFGGSKLSGKEWWKLTVLRSFELAKLEMTPQQQELVFSRIYSTFGSLQAYEKFEDTLPFLHWAGLRHSLLCGVLSNADDRYGDSILPMLGVTHDELHFQCFSKDFGIEKPNPQFFAAALKQAEPFISDKNDPLLPGHCLHIGNDYTKDFEGARRAGMHAILLDRYGEHELAQEWKRRGALVFNDLMDVVLWLGQSGCRLG